MGTNSQEDLLALRGLARYEMLQGSLSDYPEVVDFRAMMNHGRSRDDSGGLRAQPNLETL